MLLVNEFGITCSGKEIQISNDKKKLVVIAYLASIHPKGATKYGISTKSKIRSPESYFDGCMSELVSIGWVNMKESKNVRRNKLFFVTEKGLVALNKAKEIVRENHPLSVLETFDGIQYC